VQAPLRIHSRSAYRGAESAKAGMMRDEADEIKACICVLLFDKPCFGYLRVLHVFVVRLCDAGEF